ncbi:MAG: PKD domain-containing protein [Bacteroidia bacterium]
MISLVLLFSRCEKNPIGCFNSSATNVKVGEPVTFTDCSKKASGWQIDKGTPSKYAWDFGDGGTESGSVVTHVFSSPGVYNVTMVVKDEDGDRSATVTQNITVTRPSDLSRSGKFIAFTSNADGDYDIYLAQVDPATGSLATTGLIFGANPYNLTNANNLTDKEANWSADGRILIYSATQVNGDENIYAFYFNPDGTLLSSTPAHILTKTNAWDNNASFSPDGKYLVFDRRVDQNANGIDFADARDLMLAYISNMTTSIVVDSVKNISNTSGIDEGNPKWSPIISVQRIAYESPASSTANDHDIYVMDPFNPSGKVSYNNPGSSGYPAWSPDCASMIFESNSGNGGFYKIVTSSYPTNSGTTDIAKSSSKDYRYPTRVPNGNLVAFIEITVGKGNIYLISSDGNGTPVKLLPASFDNADNSYPAW